MEIYKCDTCGKEVNCMDSDKAYATFMTIKHWKAKGEKYPCPSLQCKGYFEAVSKE